MPFTPSTRIGFAQPNARMLAAICATCLSERVRALRALGISLGDRPIRDGQFHPLDPPIQFRDSARKRLRR
jgi:hypothetical protein